MKILPLTLLLFASIAVGDTLDVRTAVAPVTVRPNDNGIVRLPALPIRAAVTAACTGGRPVSLTLSSADSLARVNAGAFDDGEVRVDVTLPAEQVPPLDTRGLCATPAEPGAARKLFAIPAFVSLHVSFRCTDGTTERVTTRTASVDLELECEDERAADGRDHDPGAASE